MFLKEVSINYNFDFIYDIDWEQFEHDCLGHQQVELKDIHEILSSTKRENIYIRVLRDRKKMSFIIITKKMI